MPNMNSEYFSKISQCTLFKDKVKQQTLMAQNLVNRKLDNQE